MSKKVFLISESVLKTETIINDNVGGEYLKPSIETAQDIYLQQLIGTALLDKLYDLVADGGISNEENGHYKELIDDYISNYLKYMVLSEITLPLAYKYRNAGVVQSTGDHYQQTTLKDAQLVQNHYTLRANFYAERLLKYLNANSSDFPEYMTTRNSADMIGDKDAYQTNWVL